MLAELSVSLWRGGKDGRYETYSVPQRASQTVLDVVTFVQHTIGNAGVLARMPSEHEERCPCGAAMEQIEKRLSERHARTIVVCESQHSLRFRVFLNTAHAQPSPEPR